MFCVVFFLFGYAHRIWHRHSCWNHLAEWWGFHMSQWQSSQSPVVAVFTERKSNKLQKVCAVHAMKMAQTQSHPPKTNHFLFEVWIPHNCVKIEAWPPAYLETELAQVLVGLTFKCFWSHAVVCVFLDLSQTSVLNIYCHVAPRYDCPIARCSVCGMFLWLINTEGRLTCPSEWPPKSL